MTNISKLPSSEVMPQITLIRDRDITFLVDSGATVSGIKQSDFLIPPKLSSRYIYTVRVADTTVKEIYTTPLRVTTSDRYTQALFSVLQMLPGKFAGKRFNVCSRVNSVLHQREHKGNQATTKHGPI